MYNNIAVFDARSTPKVLLCAAVSNHYFSGTLDYFSSTLTLNQNYNLLSALAASGITPSNTKKYTGAAISASSPAA